MNFGIMWVYIGFNIFATGGSLMQYAYVGRLAFNSSPDKGLPLVPRYDIVNVTVLFTEDPELQPILVDGDHIRLNPNEISVGELRGLDEQPRSVNGLGRDDAVDGLPHMRPEWGDRAARREAFT